MVSFFYVCCDVLFINSIATHLYVLHTKQPHAVLELRVYGVYEVYFDNNFCKLVYLDSLAKYKVATVLLSKEHP